MGKRTPTKYTRNKRIVQLREEGKTFEEIAQCFNIKRQRAHEIYSREAKRNYAKIHNQETD